MLSPGLHNRKNHIFSCAGQHVSSPRSATRGNRCQCVPSSWRDQNRFPRHRRCPRDAPATAGAGCCPGKMNSLLLVSAPFPHLVLIMEMQPSSVFGLQVRDPSHVGSSSPTGQIFCHVLAHLRCFFLFLS